MKLSRTAWKATGVRKIEEVDEDRTVIPMNEFETEFEVRPQATIAAEIHETEDDEVYLVSLTCKDGDALTFIQAAEQIKGKFHSNVKNYSDEKQINTSSQEERKE